MTARDEVYDYIYNKVSTVNENNPKSNMGARLLKTDSRYETEMGHYINVALNVIQMNFIRDVTNSPAGNANLTNVSSKIGEGVCRVFTEEEYYWNQCVRIGDLFIEAFFNCGFLEIFYDRVGREGKYTINATLRWEELAELPQALKRVNLAYTTSEKPTDITGATQLINDFPHPVVKNGTPVDPSAIYTKSINKLQQTAWRVNRRVLDALLSNKEMFVSEDRVDDNKEKEVKRRSKVAEWKFTLQKAEQLRDVDAFYQYLDADYRGRLYYKEPFFNFQGSDLSRGMLKFARGKPMTPSGEYWLAVHTASSYNQSYGISEIPEWCEGDYKTHLESEQLDNISVDKMTLADRVRWTNEHMEGIILLGEANAFDAEADKKVAFLSCCVEWSEINEARERRVLHHTFLPIPIDGSNNGWQHLGAISKDKQTGDLVGLIPREIQKDFYVQTAKEMISLTTDERLIGILESMPMKSIRKAISKRGSMTRAYSAGARKIAENMYNDCKQEDYHTLYNITQDDCTKLAKILIKAISNVCPGPLDTMAYLQALAQHEIQDCLGNERIGELSWDTPSGFHVDYKNFKMDKKRCRGTISGYKKDVTHNGKDINHVALVASKYPDMRGFMCGVSPNMIHSLDASHMALVINQWNGEFGAVHDSFSTHASNVEELLALTKSTFIDMYDHENFYDYFEDQLLTNPEGAPTQPHRGSLEIQEIHNSDYFFA